MEKQKRPTGNRTLAGEMQDGCSSRVTTFSFSLYTTPTVCQAPSCAKTQNDAEQHAASLCNRCPSWHATRGGVG